MKKLVRCGARKALVLGAVLGCMAFFAPKSHANEFRAFWVDAWGPGFLNASQVNTLINHCRTYNFNAIIVQMRRRGDAFYFPQSPNQDPRTTAIASNFDALQDIINKANSGSPKIQVHCWVVSNLIWSNQSTPPPQSGHVYNKHPGYLMRNSSGSTWIAEGYYLDPGHPSAMQWNRNMAVDIVSRYNIDGFHWDYIRYPQQNSGYNPTAIARYNAEFGTSGQPAPSNTQFSNWRRRQVTDFLRWANADLLAIKPNLIISASVMPNRTDARNNRFQDWALWNNQGIIDLCMPMNYTSNHGTFQSRVDDAFNNQGVRRVYMGVGGYLNTQWGTVNQMTYSRNKPLLGTQLYSYRIPNSGTVNQTGTFNYIRNNYQPTWVNPPSLPWKNNRGVVRGTITAQSNGAAIYNATVTINTSPQRTQQTNPQGKYAFFNVPGGSYTVTASASGYAPNSGSASVTGGSVVTRNLALSAGSNIIVDNVHSGFSASSNWGTATWCSDKYGTNYRFRNTQSTSDAANWTTNIPSSGSWKVYAWWCVASDRASAAPYLIDHNGGTATVTVDQRANGGKWNLLGTYNINAGSRSVRLSCWTSSGNVVIADAVRWQN